MKAKAAGAALAVALAFSPAIGDATILSNFLTFDGPSGTGQFPPIQAGGEDKMQDDSLSRLTDIGTPGLSIGDTIFGVLTLSEILASGRSSVAIGSSSQIAIIYAATVAAGAGGTLTYIANPALLTATCGAACAGAGIIGNTMAVFLSTTQSDLNPANDPLNWDALGANGVTANFNGANGNGPWGWEMTAGLIPANGDFFAFSGDPILGGTNRAGLTITSSAFPSGFLDVDVLDFAIATHLSHLTLDTATTLPASANQQSRGWTYSDQSTLYINPTAVPVPNSLALMGLGLGIIGWVSRRKQK